MSQICVKGLTVRGTHGRRSVPVPCAGEPRPTAANGGLLKALILSAFGVVFCAAQAFGFGAEWTYALVAEPGITIVQLSTEEFARIGAAAGQVEADGVALAQASYALEMKEIGIDPGTDVSGNILGAKEEAAAHRLEVAQVDARVAAMQRADELCRGRCHAYRVN